MVTEPTPDGPAAARPHAGGGFRVRDVVVGMLRRACPSAWHDMSAAAYPMTLTPATRVYLQLRQLFNGQQAADRIVGKWVAAQAMHARAGASSAD